MLPLLALSVAALLDRLGSQHALPVALFLFGSALLEQLVPPVPGDLAVALGAAVGIAKGWSVAGLFAATVAGGLLGAVITFYFGRWLHDRGAALESPRVNKLIASVRPALAVLERRGTATLIFSRFVPVGRALCVVAAGYARLPPVRSLLAATAGLLLWDAVLFAVGGFVGAEHARIDRVLATYGKAVWGAAALVLAVVLARRWVKKRRGQRAPDVGAGQGDS